MEYISNPIHFLKTEIWQVRLEDFPPVKAHLIKYLRIILLAIKGFQKDNCQLRASGLTFYSTLSIVPVVALVFGVAKGFGFDARLEKIAREDFVGHEEVLDKVFAFSHSLLDETKGGLIAGIGVVFLLWAVMRVLTQIEFAFNEIWQVQKPRPFLRRFTEYFSLMFISPILFILSSSATAFITTQTTQIIESISILGFIAPLIFFLFKLIPIFLIMCLFTFSYMVMPNTKVKFQSALVAGALAGIIFQIMQSVYIDFQVGLSRHNAIYGSFAALPFFIIWVQISWTIVLLGAELAFAHQTVDQYGFEAEDMQISPALKRHISLLLMQRLIKNFEKGNPPLQAEDLAKELELPLRIVKQSLESLESAELINRSQQKEQKYWGYQPSRSLEQLSIIYVLETLDKDGVDKLPITSSDASKQIAEALKAFDEQLRESEQNWLLREL